MVVPPPGTIPPTMPGPPGTQVMPPGVDISAPPPVGMGPTPMRMAPQAIAMPPPPGIEVCLINYVLYFHINVIHLM